MRAVSILAPEFVAVEEECRAVANEGGVLGVLESWRPLKVRMPGSDEFESLFGFERCLRAGEISVC